MVELIHEENKEKEIEEKDVKTDRVDTNKKVLCRKLDYQKLFYETLLDLQELEQDFTTVKERYTEALVSRGIHINADDAFVFVENVLSRVSQVQTVKRLCESMGLQAHMDEIISNEMSIIYGRTRKATPQAPTSKIQGEGEGEREREREGQT